MTTPQVSWIPVGSCTLPTIERPMRVAEFDDLFARHLTGVEHFGASHVRLTLTDAAELEAHVQQLADRESDCCSFFTFTVTTRPPHFQSDSRKTGSRAATETHVLLDAIVPDAHVDVLAALVQRAQTTRTAKALS